jgi:hypothetical protein
MLTPSSKQVFLACVWIRDVFWIQCIASEIKCIAHNQRVRLFANKISDY